MEGSSGCEADRVVIYIGGAGIGGLHFILADIWTLGEGLPGALMIRGVGDYDGNGRANILFHDSAGNIGIWLIGEESITSGALVGSAPANLQIQVGTNQG